MILSERFDDALVFAIRLHRHQTRKGSDIPYIAHLMSVAALVLEHGGTEDQAIAALLHDAVEDQGGEAVFEEIRKTFGEGVAAIVADCTDAWGEPKPPWLERKEAYLAKLPEKDPVSLLVSLADKTHNAKAIRDDYLLIGDAIWDRFKGKRNGTLWYYRSLSAYFSKALPGPLSDELEKIIADLPSPEDD